MSYTIDTNLAASQVPDGFLSDTSDFLCALFDRPKKVIMGQLRSGQEFDFSGSTDHCVVMNLTRGSLRPNSTTDEEAIERYVAAISEYLQNALGVPKSRIMIFYYEHDMALIGNNGRTLKRIWSEIGTFPSD
ncbi:macrophage migration inhibitory factor-like [Metopolophium dirhodum]|uniref:macrophage migration inhibitory factor-like n=1 Tax=Metopolophium dirhodum TaxID=44670 RepID=UPI0029905C93|nr:macrophage migration inhibitory factor-like [Metopolophium dirhodum]